MAEIIKDSSNIEKQSPVSASKLEQVAYALGKATLHLLSKPFHRGPDLTEYYANKEVTLTEAPLSNPVAILAHAKQQG